MEPHMESLEQKIKRVLKDRVTIAPYDAEWPRMFAQEKRHLLECLDTEIITRVEHFGSTAIPGMLAKPIVDMLVEVTDLDETRERIAPVLEEQGYDYFWRPSFGDHTPPFYAWFIKRNARGSRTHHIHMVEHDFEQWDGLLFRDFLIEHPKWADAYCQLKLHLAEAFPDNRVAYTEGKSEFVLKINSMAKKHYTKA